MKKALIIGILATFISCKKEASFDTKNQPPAETFTSGKTNMYVDESVIPIADALVEVFQAYYTDAHINIIPNNEVAIMNSLFKDSVRLAVVPRDLKKEEIEFLSQRVRPITTPIAREAVIFIQNIQNQDTILKLDKIRELSIDKKAKIKLVFDNINSSVVRQLNDSIPINKDTPNAYFMPNTNRVIDYVSKNKNAIGVISSSWLAEPNDSIRALSNNIRSMRLFNYETKVYVKPSQSTIADKTYPFVRTINIIDIKGNAGLGKGFSAFTASDKGQRIILKSGLMPIKIPSREIEIITK